MLSALFGVSGYVLAVGIPILGEMLSGGVVYVIPVLGLAATDGGERVTADGNAGIRLK